MDLSIYLDCVTHPWHPASGETAIRLHVNVFSVCPSTDQVVCLNQAVPKGATWLKCRTWSALDPQCFYKGCVVELLYLLEPLEVAVAPDRTSII